MPIMDLETELLRTMQKEELEREIKQKIESFHGLLTREVAMRLIAKEKGLLKEEEKSYRLSEMPKDARKASFTASVKKIWPLATYASGKRFRVVEVKDETGEMPLVLWNQDVELAKGLHPRDKITVKGAYEKSGELHLGYSGAIDIVKRASFPELSELQDGETVHIRGFVNSIEGIDSFVSGTDTAKAFSFLISDGKTERRCVMWGELGRGEKLKEGDEIMVEDAIVNKGNIEISSSARILTRRPKDMLLGRITKLECKDERLFLEIDGKDITLGRESALRLMEVEAADDIALSTVATLKKDKLLNNKIAVKIEEKNGQIFIRG